MDERRDVPRGHELDDALDKWIEDTKWVDELEGDSEPSPTSDSDSPDGGSSD